MDIQKNMSRSLKYLVLIFFLTGIWSVVVADTHYFVQMNVDPNETKLVITTNKGDAGGCRGFSKKKGCVLANHGDRDVKVSFLLAGDVKCNAGIGAKWKLGNITLGGKDSSGKPTTWGGFAADLAVLADFDFYDAVSGVLNSAAPKSDRQITILDKNSSAYVVWYKVTADCLDAGGAVVKSIMTDPRIVNEG